MPKPQEGSKTLQRKPAQSEKLEPQLPAQAMRRDSRAEIIQRPSEIGQECRVGGAALKYRTRGNQAVTASVDAAAHPRNATMETRSSIILPNYNGVFLVYTSLVNLSGTSLYYGACSRKIGIRTRDIGDTTAFVCEYTHAYTHTRTRAMYIPTLLPRDLSFHSEYIPRKGGHSTRIFTQISGRLQKSDN